MSIYVYWYQSNSSINEIYLIMEQSFFFLPELVADLGAKLSCLPKWVVPLYNDHEHIDHIALLPLHSAVHISFHEQVGHIIFLPDQYILMLSDMHHMRCKIYIMHICIICRLVSLKLHYIATDCMLIDLGRWVTTSSLTIWRKKWFRPAKLLQRSIIDLLTLGTAQSCWNLAWRAPVRSVTNLLKTSPLARSWDCLTYR